MSEPKKMLFETLFSDTNGYHLSVTGRNKLPHATKAHTYGEVTYDGFKAMLALADPKADEVFYDLGSGTGKAVILASLFVPFKKLIGIEVIKDLYDASNSILLQYEKLISENPAILTYRPMISYIHSDFNDADFSDADIIYMNSTCFDYELAHLPFIRKMETLKVGTRVITNSIPLISPYYESKPMGEFKFSWGNASVFLQTKIK